MFSQQFDYGDFSLLFAQVPQKNTKKSAVGLKVLPKGASYEPKGSDAPLFYAEYTDGISVPVKVLRQVRFLSGSLNSYFADEGGMEYTQKLVFDRETGVFTVSIRCENKSTEERTLRFLSSFSFGFAPKRGTKLYRMGSACSYAYSFLGETIEDLGLGFENSPPLAFGRDGRFLPFAAVQTENGVLAMRLDSANQFEIILRRSKERLELFGGERIGNKTIPPGGYHETCKVHIVLQPSLEDALRALNRRMAKKLSSEEELPVVCSAENISIGNVKKFSALLRDLNIPAAVLEEGKKPRTEEETEKILQKFIAEGVRMESGLSGVFSLPRVAGATAIAAANFSRVYPARRTMIDFEVLPGETKEETLFKFCAAAMGRIRLKGELLKLGEEQISLLKEAFSFYERIFEIVRSGEVFLCEFTGCVSSEPLGRQIYGKEFGGSRLLFVHFYGEEGTFKLPLEGYELKDEFSTASFGVRAETLRIAGQAGQAGIFLLERKGDI